jgi:Cu/Ag efflux protein CusF
MKSIFSLVAAALLAILCHGPVRAQDVKAITVLKDASPVMYGRSLKLKAVVDAVDLEKREITLRPASGRTVALRVDPRVKNLPDVKPGDEVSVRYHQAVGLSLRKVDSGEAPPDAQAGSVVPASGQDAGVARQTLMASVDRVEVKGKTVAIRTTDDRFVELYVRDPGVLEALKAGDTVEATFTEAAVVLIELPRDKKEEEKNKKKKKK